MIWRAPAFALLIAVCCAQPRRVPPPMFSPQYVEALQGVLDLEPRDAAALEKRLAADPEDYAARLKLMAYDLRADRAALASSRRQRAELALWLVEHHPDSEILASPYAIFARNELDDRAERLWREALEKNPHNVKVLWNAADFYAPRDPQKYLQCAESAVALASQDERGGTNLGLFYAQQIVNQSNLSPLAIAHLDAAKNPFVLEGAVRLLKSAANRALMLGQADRRLSDLASRYFARAQSLDPNLDAAWINPQIDPKMIGMMARPAPPPAIPANAEYRRLKPTAFPDLPPSIASFLNARGCTIPQPSTEGPPRNVIRGEFFEKGHSAWAVLCAAQGSASIFAFRSASDSHPAELENREISGFLEHTSTGAFFYDREIRAAGRKFILDHYRAYGGPQPPPIDHLGIDDGSQHGSLTLYWYQGQWRKLTGAD